MTGAAFSKRLRLRNPAQFRVVFDSAELRVSAGEVLLLARCNSLEHPRVGIVIGRKVCPLASRRNFFKRSVRESYRRCQGELSGLDIIVLARAGVAGLDRPVLNSRLAALWTKLARRRHTLQGGTTH